MVNPELSTVEINIEDTGTGIPETQQKEIFERFRQARNYIHDFVEGTGLGLSISKGFADALGGNIMLKSEEGKGSTFTLIINYNMLRSGKKAYSYKVTDEISTEPDYSRKTILIAEDEEINANFLIETLSPTGANVIWAKDGLSAIQKFNEEEKIDLILMDIKMPVLNGLTASKQIKESDRNVPIVAQTAFGLEGDREKFLRNGCDDYISKPISKNVLFNTLSKYL